MKNLKEDFVAILQNERGVLMMMIAVFLVSVILFVFSITKIDPSSSVVKIGYGDIGGYSDGAWTNMIMYPVFALIFGILHNLVALRIYEKRGATMAKFFLFITIMLIMGAFLIINRLTSGM